jgi:long-chain acyl-CoA synthetase
VARRVGADILDGKPVAFGDRLQYGLGNVLVYGPLRTPWACRASAWPTPRARPSGPTCSASSAPSASTSSSSTARPRPAPTCLQDGEVKLDTVGQAAPGVELKIADNGEVLVRSRSLLKEYYKRPDATAEVLDAEATSTPATPA